jgi:hypothetical protein
VLTPQAGDNEGYPTRAEMAKRYAKRTGRDLLRAAAEFARGERI